MPLLGLPAPSMSWAAAIAITVVGAALALVFFGRNRTRIAYWL